MTRDDRIRWEARYGAGDYPLDKAPNPLLVQYAPPGNGALALDLACGPGHNTRWLAAHGYRAVGVDISHVALRYATDAAAARPYEGRLYFVQADLDRFVLVPHTFDLICMFHFLDRGLLTASQRALRPGGWLIAETLNRRRLETHPDTPPAYLVAEGELAQIFADFTVISADQRADLSYIVAQRPK